MFGYKKTQTTPYRPEGNSVLEQFHSIMHNTLAMFCDVIQNNWTDMLPFVQMANSMAYHSTVLETPHYLMVGRSSVLPSGIILGPPKAETLPKNTAQYMTPTVKNVRFAH